MTKRIFLRCGSLLRGMVAGRRGWRIFARCSFRLRRTPPIIRPEPSDPTTTQPTDARTGERTNESSVSIASFIHPFLRSDLPVTIGILVEESAGKTVEPNKATALVSE